VKALVITTSYPLSAEVLDGSFVKELLDGLDGTGWSFEVVTPAASTSATRTASGTVTVHEARGWGSRGLAHARGIPEELGAEPWKWLLVPSLISSLAGCADRVLRQGEFDLLWSHWLFPSGALGAILARRYRLPHLCTAHGADVHLLERLARFPGARGFLEAVWSRTRLTTPVEHTARRVSDALGSVPVTALALPASEPVDKMKVGAGGGLRLLFLGRFEIIKGMDLLLRAAAKLPPGSLEEITLAGAGSQERAVRGLAAGLGLPVHFPGVLGGDAKRRAIRQAHAVVLPSRVMQNSRAEGMPHAAMESLVQGTPVLAPRQGALGRLLEETGAGLVYDQCGDDAGRVESLAGALQSAAAGLESWELLRSRARDAGQPFCSHRSLESWRLTLRDTVEARA
jgi:glycosyltransferase involved in cell wall biosynthesis